ncbi:MAG TPA: hypothetical protein PKL75_10175 [Treponemataceae bacterium]|nr:hypothetical protein [Treponemataceae bacterium]
MKTFPKSLLVAALVISIAQVRLAAVVPSADYPESASPRAGVFDSWLGLELDRLIALKSETLANALGDEFTIAQKKDAKAGTVTISVTPKVTEGDQGTWRLTRSLTDGKPLSIRVYPVKDSSIWITLRPDGPDPERGKTLLTLTIYGADAISDVPLGFPFVRMYVMPLATIVSQSKNSIEWGLLTPDPYAYASVLPSIEAIREGLPSLVYLDDGCFNERGEPVYIETGLPQDNEAVFRAAAKGQDRSALSGGVNCSGFAKWLVDGIVRPATGGNLFIAPLKEQTSSPETLFTEPYRESRDLFFALDWTRNLASAAASLSSGRTVKPDASGVDVIVSRLPGITPHSKDVGYRVRDLAPILYYLASKEPGHFYLGAESRERGDPPLRQYHHIAAFFPYFDGNGRFTVAVFESARESTLGAHISQNSDAWVNLVRIRLPEQGYFLP